jgi:hypothetical protein
MEICIVLDFENFGDYEHYMMMVEFGEREIEHAKYPTMNVCSESDRILVLLWSLRIGNYVVHYPMNTNSRHNTSIMHSRID